METILKIENIEKYYGNKSNITKAIDNISFSVEKVSMLRSWEHPEVGRRHCLTAFLP